MGRIFILRLRFVDQNKTRKTKIFRLHEHFILELIAVSLYFHARGICKNEAELPSIIERVGRAQPMDSVVLIDIQPSLPVRAGYHFCRRACRSSSGEAQARYQSTRHSTQSSLNRPQPWGWRKSRMSGYAV